jgi:hypothetical protein
MAIFCVPLRQLNGAQKMAIKTKLLSCLIGAQKMAIKTKLLSCLIGAQKMAINMSLTAILMGLAMLDEMTTPSEFIFIILTLHSMIFVLGVLGNTSICYTIYLVSRKKPIKVTHFFIASMATIMNDFCTMRHHLRNWTKEHIVISNNHSLKTKLLSCLNGAQKMAIKTKLLSCLNGTQKMAIKTKLLSCLNGAQKMAIVTTSLPDR